MTGVSGYAIAAVLCLQTLSNCAISTVGQYIYAYFLQTYSSNQTHNSTNSSTNSIFTILQIVNDAPEQCSESSTTASSDAQAWAQQQSANLFFWTNLASSCPVIIMTYILGLYTPKLGRRFVLILPMVGTAIQISIWLAIVYFQLPQYWWFVAAVIVGLSGSGGVLGFVLNLIITDSTIASERSSRFVLLGSLTTALSAIATFGIGYYIGWRGFTDLFWSGLALQLISIIVVIFFFKSSDFLLEDETTSLLSSSPISDEIKESSSFTCGHCFEVCTVFRLNRRSRKKSASLWLTLFSFMFYTLATSAFAPYLWFLLNVPFCWSSKDIGNYSTFGAIANAILGVLGMKALTRVGASDVIICTISHMFFASACLWIAFARQSWELYGGALFLSPFSSYQGSLTMSMMSTWLGAHERSNAFTFVTEISTIITVFGNSFFNWVYARTVVDHRNFTMLLAAGLTVIPFILNICLYLVTRRLPDEDIVPLSETDTEPAPFRIPTSLPPRAGDAACLVIPSRSLTSSLRTPPVNRSRANSCTSLMNDDTDTITMPIATTDDLMIL